MKPQNRLNKEEVTLSKEEEIFRLRVQGWSQYKIADHLKMTQQGISKALKRATQRFAKAYLEDMKVIKDEQVAQLEHVASEAIGAWYESKQNRKSTRTKIKGSKDSKKRSGEKTETEEAMHGDPRYLTEYRKAKSDIREILGIKYIPSEEDDDEEPLGEIRIKVIKPVAISSDDKCE